MPRKTGAGAGANKWRCGFNEAAARCRGKPFRGRPRRRRRRRFNEAAARCRGKHPLPDMVELQRLELQ